MPYALRERKKERDRERERERERKRRERERERERFKWAENHQITRCNIKMCSGFVFCLCWLALGNLSGFGRPRRRHRIRLDALYRLVQFSAPDVSWRPVFKKQLETYVF